MNKKFFILMLFVLFLSMSIVSANEIEDNITAVSDESPIEIVDGMDYVSDDIYLEGFDILQVSSDDLIQSDNEVIVVNDWEELQYYCSLSDKDYTLRLKENTNFYPNLNYTQQIIINNNVKIIGSESSWIGDSRYNPWTIKEGNVYGDYIKYTPIIVPDDNGKGLTLENVTFKWINTVYNPDAVFFTNGWKRKICY